jgi:hypothetical protein
MRAPKDLKAPHASEVLLRQLKEASEKDLNPYSKGGDGELISTLGASFPEVCHLRGKTVPLEGDGWISGDFLHFYAELSEREGTGLLELEASDNRVYLLGLSPDSSFWKNISSKNRSEERKAKSCSFWGNCLGQRLGFLPEVLEILSSLNALLAKDFRLYISACPKDCRYGIERSDLSLVLSEDGESFALWSGGRHRPFRKPVPPTRLVNFPKGARRDLLAAIVKIHDFYEDEKEDEECLPEFLVKFGAEKLKEKFLYPYVYFY